MGDTKSIASNRVLEMELMKAVAIIGMVMVHVLGISILIDMQAPANAPVVFVIGFFGGIPSAGVFMFAMGWGTAFSKRATVSSYLNRCVKLFAAGVFVNLFTGYLRAILVPDVFGPLNAALHTILATDIYFFAALAHLYFALMKKLESRNTLRAVISVFIVGICICINILVPPESFTTGSIWLDTILGLFIRLNDKSYFPFICWIFFPVIGFGAGCFFRKNGMKKTTIAAAITGAAALIISLPLMSALGLGRSLSGAAYYGLHPVLALFGYSIIAAEFLIVRVILLAAKNRLPNLILTMSKNVSSIYIVQWAIISILSPALVLITNVWINVAAGIAILAVSYYLGKILKEKNIINI